MAPTTRRAGATALDVIVVHGSDSDSDSDAVAEKSPPRKHTSKRQKTGTGSQDRKSTSLSEDEDEDEDGDHEIDSDFATTPSPLPLPSMAPKHKVVYNADKNAHLKGRRRFVADLADMKEECETAGGFEVQGLRVSKIRAGDDEGSIEVKVSKAGVHVLAVNLLISDTSDYPKNHTFFAFSPDSGVPPDLSEVVDTISTAPSRPIRAAIQKVILDLAKVVNPQQGSQSQSQETEIEDEDEGEGDDFEDYDGYDFDDYTSGHHTNGIPALDLGRLQHDFLDTVASGYRPGLIRYGIDDFSLSVSIPVVSLAESISPRALMAWDRRLLSRTQYLTLLISGMSGKYPFIASDGTIPRGMTITFKVGLTKRYKPSKEHAKDVGRTFGLIGADAEDEIRAEAELREKQMEWAGDDIALLPEDDGTPMIIDTAQDEEEDDGRFDRFSLSSSLESLLDQVLLTVIQFRRKFGLGWAGAETLFSEVERTQRRPEDVFETMQSEILKADQIEAKLGQTYDLPHDALVALNKTDQINLPLTAFSYLVRRLTLCTRYCIVCHNPINTDFEALKPYVCDSKLCSYQYYSLNRGPSLEYEIRNNPDTVDLLVSIAYSAAAELVIEDPLPIGMGLRVPVPDPKRCLVNPANNNVVPQGTPAPAPAVAKPPPIVDAAGLCEFDDLDLFQMRASIAQLIDSLPPVYDMKKHLERKVKAGKYKPKLKDMDPNVLPSAWSILRWCVASCTAHLEEITSPEERVQNLDQAWRQFRFSVGAPDAESKFKRAVEDAQKVDKNAKKYPSLYAFHGSAVRNWHSIIRHGLWFKNVANGRAYGHGVYLAKDGTVSMGHYAAPSRTAWRNSRISPTNCVALAEIVNLPSEFVSSNPYFVVKDTHWIVCRYLLVKSLDPPLEDPNTVDPVSINVPMVPLDPAHPVTLSGAKSASQIKIPQPSHQLEMLLAARKAEYFIEEHDEEDLAVFQYKPSAVENGISQSRKEEIVLSDDDDDDGMDIDYYDDDDQPPPTKTGSAKGKAKAVQNSRSANDWQHDAEWVNSAVELLMPPPVEANPSATMAVQRELRSMLSEQDKALNSKGGLSELGWYMPPDLIGDNLFQWIVEMHSFDQDLPIAQDLKAKGVNSLIFEIRFPPSFPNTPPFFRIITPRFLPFIHGGGGHVTGGGSMCMDLLTSSGWVPTYSIPAVLMQIKLAISNLEPRPARLSPDWQKPYAIGEALEGYKRAAATHGWKLPEGLDKLAR